MINKILLSLIGITVVLLALVSCGPSMPLLTLRNEPPEYILNAGRLGALPESAQNIQAAGWSGLFTGASYARFQADRTDIEHWIHSCQSLSNASIKEINEQHRIHQGNI